MSYLASLLKETFINECISIICIELGKHFSVTRIRHSDHFSVTRNGHSSQISVTTSTRMMKKRLNLRMKTRFVKSDTVCIVHRDLEHFLHNISQENFW